MLPFEGSDMIGRFKQVQARQFDEGDIVIQIWVGWPGYHLYFMPQSRQGSTQVFEVDALPAHMLVAAIADERDG